MDTCPARDIIDANSASATALSGGVSNIVIAVSDHSRAVVLKQSLPRLRVAEDWPAPRSRTLAEAAALDLVARMSPDFVPHVLDRDPARFIVVLEHAPDDWNNWKALLLAQVIEPTIGGKLGDLLARWHSTTFEDSTLSPYFSDPCLFEQLRIDPYYRTVALRHPDLAMPIEHQIELMLDRRLCLVHGDFSPKNVLVGPRPALWVVDFEVGHIGDPAFDVAFLLSHLLIKSIHLHDSADRYDECMMQFVAAYVAAVGPELAPHWTYVNSHVGCLLLARVSGKSRIEYLRHEDRVRTWELGRRYLFDPPESPAGLFELRDKMLCSPITGPLASLVARPRKRRTAS